jgi:hypothetical protein
MAAAIEDALLYYEAAARVWEEVIADRDTSEERFTGGPVGQGRILGRVLDVYRDDCRHVEQLLADAAGERYPAVRMRVHGVRTLWACATERVDRIEQALLDR